MNPNKSPATFKFLEAVFDSEKEALNKKISSLAKTAAEKDEEEVDVDETTNRLIRRLSFVTKYWEDNKSSHPLIYMQNGKPEIACPRCLVHTGTLNRMSFLVESMDGEMELICKTCELHNDALHYQALPPPSVPL